MEDSIIDIVYLNLDSRIKRVCSDCYDELFLDSYIEWLNEFVGEWFSFMSKDPKMIDLWMNKMRYHIHSAIYQLRFNDRLLEIIQDFLNFKPLFKISQVLLQHFKTLETRLFIWIEWNRLKRNCRQCNQPKSVS